MNLDYLTTVVLDGIDALGEIRVPQAHLTTRSQPEELHWRVFHEIVALDV